MLLSWWPSWLHGDDDGDDDDDYDDDDDDDDDYDDDDDDDDDDDVDGDDDDHLACAGLGWSGGRDGFWRMLGSNVLNYHDASTEATANIPSWHAATRTVGCSTPAEELIYLLHATLPRPHASLSKDKGFRIENQQERRK